MATFTIYEYVGGSINKQEDDFFYIPFCGQWVWTGKLSYSMMTPMVQLSPSLCLASFSVSLSKSVFSFHRSRWSTVKLMLSLRCSDMTVVTPVREDTVTVALTCHGRTSSKTKRLTVATEWDDHWHQDDADDPQSCRRQLKPSVQWSFLFILYREQQTIKLRSSKLQWREIATLNAISLRSAVK